MDSGRFDVLHDSPDDGDLAVGDNVDVDFHGIFEEAVHKDGAFRRGVDGFPHVTGQFFVVIDDHHGSSAKDERGAD